jgi:PDZ domain-containing protein
LAVGAGIIAGFVVDLPYYALEPGSVYDTIDRVEAPADLETEPQGEIGFVTVAQTANISPWEWLDAKLDKNTRIRHEDEVRGDQTADELREADLRRMQVSKSDAVVVALQRLGYDLTITPTGIEVAQVFDCTAADGTLNTGDLIVGVNGIDTRSGEQLIDRLSGMSVGDSVDLLVERIDPNNPTQSLNTDEVPLTLGSADAECLSDDIRAEEPRAFIGISTLTMYDEDFPIEVNLRTGRVSGPSAGLAFTLAIMDVLSEGELTNGLNVVATGTINRDGEVGPVGGIHQKTVAARQGGADVFLVPKCCDNFRSRDTGEPVEMLSNYEEALLYAEDMTVIGVDNLDEALEAIAALGGDVDEFLE